MAQSDMKEGARSHQHGASRPESERNRLPRTGFYFAYGKGRWFGKMRQGRNKYKTRLLPSGKMPSGVGAPTSSSRAASGSRAMAQSSLEAFFSQPPPKKVARAARKRTRKGDEEADAEPQE